MKKEEHILNIAFDIDNTLWRVRERIIDGKKVYDQVPDYDLIGVLRWFYNNGDKCYAWSAGGVDYCRQIMVKLGLDEMVEILSKPPLNGNDPRIDISFDDCEITMGKVNVLLNRPDYNE